MIEQKIHAGEFLDFGALTGYAQLPGTGQVSVNTEDRQIGVSSNFFGPKKRAVATGDHPSKAHRNFIWIPWADNGTNYAESQGKDILSGPFSGCYMVVYNYNGSRRVAHIATPGAKNAWNHLVATDPLLQIVAGFLPHNGVPITPGLATGNDSVFKFFGLVTAANDLYSILAFTQHVKGSMKADIPHMRIAAIAQVASLSVAQLSILP